MLELEHTRLVERPIDQVLAYLKDYRHAQEWRQGTIWVTREGKGPIRVGTTWRTATAWRGTSVLSECRLTELAAEHVTFECRHRYGLVRDRFAMVPLGTATALTRHTRVSLSVLARVARPLLRRSLEQAGERSLLIIARAVHEQRPDAAPGPSARQRPAVRKAPPQQARQSRQQRQ